MKICLIYYIIRQLTNNEVGSCLWKGANKMTYYSYKGITKLLNKIAYHLVTISEVKDYLIDSGYLAENEPTYKAQGLFYYNNKGRIQWSEIVVQEIENKYFEKI